MPDPTALYDEATKRYRAGEWRARVFHDLILGDLLTYSEPTVLDIGCGRGFDADPKLSATLSSHAKIYLGIEPDSSIALQPIFSHVYHSYFEQAPIVAESVDVAFCVMVLEHIKTPKPFIERLYQVLRPKGVFWGFTVDSRHYFAMVSKLAERLSLKERYLRLTHGERGVDRYENYPVYYRMNKPADFLSLVNMFSSQTFINFYRPGQLDFYYTRTLRPMGRVIERAAHLCGIPGSLLAIRLQK